MKLFVGIDVSSQKLDVCFMDSEDHILHEATPVSYTHLLQDFPALPPVPCSYLPAAPGWLEARVPRRVPDPAPALFFPLPAWLQPLPLSLIHI